MKKVIGIYCGDLTDYKWDEESILRYGGGGSETWAVELAKAFQEFGFHVIVFGNPEVWKFAESGVEYVPFQMYRHRIQYQKFDYFISSRHISELDFDLSCQNVYIMAHDICLHYANTYEEMKMDRVKKIAYLSKWHQWTLSDWYKHDFNDTDSFLTANGVDLDLYKDASHTEKKNKMVWSSRSERGLRFMLSYVFPRIKCLVHDFEMDVCLYMNEMGEDAFKDIEGVNFIGKVGKEELSRRQMESKLWVYPNFGFLDSNGSPFLETFCISAVENGMAQNAIITSPLGGICTTLNGYGEFFGSDLMVRDENTFNGYISGAENLDKYADELAEAAIKALTNEPYREMLAKKAYHVSKKYTWKNAALTWLKEWGFIYE